MRIPSPSRRLLLLLFLPLAIFCFFGSLLMAVWLFPEPYDWRFRVMSNLLSPRDNPEWYRIPSFGIGLAGVFLWPLASYFEDRLRPVSRGLAQVGRWSLGVAILLLICAAIVVPQHVRAVFGFTRLHETLARTSAIGFGISMLCICACGWKDLRRGRRLDRWLLPIWSGLTIVPVSGILISEALLWIAHSSPTWGVSVKQAMRHSVFWHLGFWEWAGSVAVFAFFFLSAWLLPEQAG